MASSLSWQLQPQTDTSLDNAVYHRIEAAVAKRCYFSVLLLPRLLSLPSHAILLAVDLLLLPRHNILLGCNSRRDEVPFRALSL
jgi:hypothetical protein